MVEPEPVRLVLYVAGQSTKSLIALANLRRICAEDVDGAYEIEVIDLVLHPQRARSDEILAIPTLVRHLPTQTRRLIGDMSDTTKVLACLRL